MPTYLRRVEVARRLGVSPLTIRRWEKAGKWPAPTARTPSGKPLWSEHIVVEHVAARPAPRDLQPAEDLQDK